MFFFFTNLFRPKDFYLRSSVPHRHINFVRGFRNYVIWYVFVGLIGYKWIYQYDTKRTRTYRIPRKAHFVQANQLHLAEDDPTYYNKYKSGKSVFVY